MKDFLKVLGLVMLSGVSYILLVTVVLNGELAPLFAYVNYTLSSLLIPGVVSSALVKALLLKK